MSSKRRVFCVIATAHSEMGSDDRKYWSSQEGAWVDDITKAARAPDRDAALAIVQEWMIETCDILKMEEHETP